MVSTTLPIVLVEYSGSSISNESNLSPEYFIRELIIEAMRKESGITSFYESQLRNILALFNDIVIKLPDSSIRDVKCVPGSPERTIGKLNKDELFTLPIIGVEQIQTTEDTNNRKYISLVSTSKAWDKNKQRAIRIVSLVPKAVQIEYNIAVWTKYKEDMDQITEQIHRKFTPSVDVNTPFTKYGKIFLSGEINGYNTDQGDAEDRILQKVFLLNVETHIPYPKFLMTNTGALERIYLQTEIES